MDKIIIYRDQQFAIKVELHKYLINDTHTVTRHKITVDGDNDYQKIYRINSDLDLKEEVLKAERKTKKYIDSQLEVILTPEEEILHLLGYKK